MKIYSVIDACDVGAWVGGDGEDQSYVGESDPLFATLASAEEFKSEIDRAEIEKWKVNNAAREARNDKISAARAILEINNFDGVDEVLPDPRPMPFRPTEEFRSRKKIITLEVTD